jgi:hypothetical protein
MSGDAIYCNCELRASFRSTHGLIKSLLAVSPNRHPLPVRQAIRHDGLGETGIQQCRTVQQGIAERGREQMLGWRDLRECAPLSL